MPITRQLVKLLKHHEQGAAGTVIAVRRTQAARMIADGLAVDATPAAAPVTPPAPTDAVSTPQTEAGAGRKPRR